MNLSTLTLDELTRAWYSSQDKAYAHEIASRVYSMELEEGSVILTPEEIASTRQTFEQDAGRAMKLVTELKKKVVGSEPASRTKLFELIEDLEEEIDDLGGWADGFWDV